MKIRELYIRNFGKFSEQRFVLRDDMQIFYGENEYGKTTIYAFIKAMLFGMERGRGRAALHDDFSRYEPWDNPNYYAGMMRFSCGGRNFRLERNFDRYARKAVLVCEDDGEELSVEQGDLSMLLDGMTAETFENTAAVCALTGKPGQGLADELANYAANYCGTGSSDVDLSGAKEALKKRRKELESRIREADRLQEEKRRELELRLGYMEQEKERLEQERQKKWAEAEKVRQNLQLDSAAESSQGDTGTGSAFMLKTAAGVVLLVLGMVLAVLLYKSAGWLPGVSLVLTGLFLLIWGVSGKKKDRAVRTKREDAAQERRNRLQKAGEKLVWDQQRIREEETQKQIEIGNLKETLEELEEPSGEVVRMRTTIQALELAEQKLEETAAKMAGSFGKQLHDRASEILEAVTDGAYHRLLIEEPLKLTLLKEGRRIPIERVSRGTMEQVYFALRMAALDILYGDEMPAVLDDAFVYYDKKRLNSTLKWLREQPRQVIIFSCHETIFRHGIDEEVIPTRKEEFS